MEFSTTVACVDHWTGWFQTFNATVMFGRGFPEPQTELCDKMGRSDKGPCTEAGAVGSGPAPPLQLLVVVVVHGV